MTCFPAGTFSPFCCAAYSGSIQIVRKPRLVSVPSTQIRACITHLAQGLTNAPWSWCGSATLTHRSLPTLSIPSELPMWTVCSQGMLPSLYSIQNGRSRGVCEWTQNHTRPNLTCVASHQVHAGARQTYLRLCDTATGSGT